MARWGKNIVVPLDSLIKEKENTNRPTAARSAGTVGKWGKMGFTSTRTYALQSITAELSPGQSPDAATGSTGEGDSSPTREAPKPKKFFKSRNSATTLISAQIIQHLPRAPPSPIRDVYPASGSQSSSNHRNTVIKLKVPKAPAERKNSSSSSERIVKPKKKKEEKKLKPEAPPSRVTSRSRKVVNYNEEDDYERCPTPLKDIIMLKTASNPGSPEPEELEPETELEPEEEPSPVIAIVKSPVAVPAAPPPLPPPPKTPSVEHPPIVLRISKGTSRLVSTDSEEQLNSPQHDFQSHTNNIIAFNSTTSTTTTTSSSEPHKTSITSYSAINSADKPLDPTTTTNIIPQSATASVSPPPPIPKVIVKPLPAVPSSSLSPLPPPEPAIPIPAPFVPSDEPEEFNYCTVKISPDKPPKERLKLIIKTDVIRNALAAAAAAAAAAASNSAVSLDKPEKEKKSKSKKHKHLKNIMATTKEGEFKTPSPQQSTDNYRTIISPPTLSEKDFDSQSSVLGSISSKGNSTPLAQAIPDEACVIRSRGSSDITSDLETSQHSSLVAPPSDIESRLESMMDGEDTAEAPKEAVINEEPLQEDILEVLTGGVEPEVQEPEELPVVQEEPTTRRVTRGKRAALKEPIVKEVGPVIKELPAVKEPEIKETFPIEPVSEEPQEEISPKEVQTPRRTRRGVQNAQAAPDTAIEITPPTVSKSPTRRTTRRKNTPAKTTPVEEEPQPVTPPAEVVAKRGGRQTRNNNLNNNNNKSPIAKADTVQPVVTPPPVLRSYGRKRKNPLATNEGGLSPAKITPPAEPPFSNIDIDSSLQTTSSIDIPHEAEQLQSNTIPTPFDEPVSLVVPKLTVVTEEVQRRDYKIKDKFKRTWLERDAREQQEAAEKAAAAEQLAKSEAGAHKLDQDEEMVQPAAMKLVISKKKGSIFKSRVADQFPKRHLYKHRWDEQLNGEQSRQAANQSDNPAPAKTVSGEIFEDFSEDCEDTSDVPQPKLTRFVKQPTGGSKFDEEPVTSVRCERKAKEYYTVVRNVKTAHQIQEFGEYQEINDDVDYFLEALQPHNQISTRCLSAIKLASKCMTPGFRMHVRAHGVVTKFFKALSDAHKDLSLGLCTSAIMFILSQDALNMDLDRDSLELMMNLLEVDVSDPAYFPEITSYNRNKKTVTEMCEEIKSQGKATHLNMETISSGTLAMETLLSLTSKRAGEWFKEELRNLGGLEHIIKVICDCCTQIMAAEEGDSISWTPSLLENLKTIERCLRVLENVTQVNELNQDFILKFSNGEAINTLFKLYKMCDRELCLHPTTDATSKNNPGVVLREALIPTLKVLINLTHPFDSNANGSALLGQRHEIFDISLHILLQCPNYIPERCVFELSMLVLLLLINLTMHTVDNRTCVMKAMAPPDLKTFAEQIPAVKALVEYFYKCEELARLVEKNTDAILDNTEQKKKQEEVDETVNNLLQKAGHHMEHTLKGSYAGILIAHLITDSEENERVVRTYLRENGFKDITGVLEKYYTFMNLTASSEATIVQHIKSTKKLIDNLKKRDIINEGGTTTPTKYNDSASTSSNSSPAIATRSTQRVYKTYSQR
ncbi:protein wings apart-like [Episyrphus balteatus]|uniref:protein wings apart-like n=1 Tax=Episyrphus balteatus TaxID=286459 RepID=UPI002485CDFA|nr:protein wings apart-like [Episyrphus balteatus]